MSRQSARVAIALPNDSSIREMRIRQERASFNHRLTGAASTRFLWTRQFASVCEHDFIQTQELCHSLADDH
jgi:hypothetical protein